MRLKRCGIMIYRTVCVSICDSGRRDEHRSGCKRHHFVLIWHKIRLLSESPVILVGLQQMQGHEPVNATVRIESNGLTGGANGVRLSRAREAACLEVVGAAFAFPVAKAGGLTVLRAAEFLGAFSFKCSFAFNLFFAAGTGLIKGTLGFGREWFVHYKNFMRCASGFSQALTLSIYSIGKY
jgi:hypothetical protein